MTILTRASLLTPRLSLARSYAGQRFASTSALVLLSHKSGELVPASYNAITAAKKLGGKVTGLIVGDESAKEVAEKAKA